METYERRYYTILNYMHNFIWITYGFWWSRTLAWWAPRMQIHLLQSPDWRSQPLNIHHFLLCGPFCISILYSIPRLANKMLRLSFQGDFFFLARSKNCKTVRLAAYIRKHNATQRYMRTKETAYTHVLYSSCLYDGINNLSDAI